MSAKQKMKPTYAWGLKNTVTGRIDTVTFETNEEADNNSHCYEEVVRVKITEVKK